LLGSLPLFIIGSGVFLWFNLGISGIIGLLVVVIHLPIIMLLGKLYGKYKYMASSIVDSRMKKIINFIEGIRIVKLHGWEKPFIESIFNKRSEEIDRLKKNSLISCINKSLNYGAIGLVIFVTFTIHVTLGNKINSSSAFSSITVLMYFIMILLDFGSSGITGFFTIKSALTRLTSFLCLEEKKSTINMDNIMGKYSMRIKFASFTWINEEKNNKHFETVEDEKENNNSKSTHELSGINFKVKPGELLEK
jgi:ABC-type multidrug transport system fused ATPase/permease subunit